MDHGGKDRPRAPASGNHPSYGGWDIPQPPIEDNVRASPTVGYGAATSIPSRYSDTDNISGRRYHPYSNTPSCHRQPPITSDSNSTMNTTIQQGAFANAQNFTIGVAYMSDGGRTEEDRRAEEERKTKEERRAEEMRQAMMALERLAAKGMPNAMLNSKERAYAPRCNEDTRRTIRDRIVSWARNIEEIRNLIWLSGPAAVGKSAIAQTVAEQLKAEGVLGAALFFSRPNDRSDPDSVIPTLVYQLTLLLSEYKRIVVQKLCEDPLILNKDRRSLFNELIIDPFRMLASEHPSPANRPLVIILDGLDECRDRKAQCEFIEVISHYVHSEPHLGLRWIICSRPEPDLQVAFSRPDCKAICLEEKLEVDDSEAQDHARRILNKGFAEIRERYPNQLTQDWPPEDQVRLIADRASGHLGFVSFIIRFIGDEYYDDPSGQLDVCLEFLKHAGGSTNTNPLHVLDLLYTQILFDIPANILPTTQRILCLFVFYGNTNLTIAAHVNFLGLTQASFYRALTRLHSVLLVPSVSEAGKRGIQMYHASFSDYLKDPTRSGKFALEEGVVPYLEVVTSGLKWLCHGRAEPSAIPELTWTPPSTSRETVLDSLCMFSFKPCWKACPQVPEDSQTTLVKALENFDFNLAYETWWKYETRVFAYFIRWLASLGTCTASLIVIDPCDKDIRSVKKRKTVVWHEDNDPHAFAAPLIKSTAHPERKPYIIDILLGRSNHTLLSLQVDSRWLYIGFK